MNASFDKAATVYDETFTHSVIGKLQRQFVYQHLDHILDKKPLTVLEINCGTGEDARWLAAKGHTVTATDISENMVRIAQNKPDQQNINFRKADINDLAKDFGSETFDLIFSNFGGLNCLSEVRLELFFRNAAEILSKKGQLALVIMPRNTLWEQLYFLTKGDFRNAFRRKKENVLADVNGEKVLTYYYNPKEMLTLAGRYFERRQLNPIGAFVPPSYLEPLVKNRPGLVSLLQKMERAITNRSFAARYADHYLIVFEKR